MAITTLVGLNVEASPVPCHVIDLDTEAQFRVCKVETNRRACVDGDDDLPRQAHSRAVERSPEDKLQVRLGRPEPLDSGFEHLAESATARPTSCGETTSSAPCAGRIEEPSLQHLFEDGLESQIVKMPRQVAEQSTGAKQAKSEPRLNVAPTQQIGSMRMNTSQIDRSPREKVNVFGEHLAEPPPARRSRTRQRGVRGSKQRGGAALVERHGIGPDAVDAAMNGHQ